MNLESYNYSQKVEFKDEFFRYLSFWPYFLISIVLCLFSAFLFLRYTQFQYYSEAKIEILDKAQESEMALPTSMTIFNRSMINLENEIGVLNSVSLHRKTVSNLNSNVKYYSIGRLKNNEEHYSQFFEDFQLKFKIDTDSIKNKHIFDFFINNDKLEINYTTKDESKSYKFKSLTTLNDKHDLPFELTITEYNPEDLRKQIIIYPFLTILNSFNKLTKVSPSSQDSDQLILSMTHPNRKIADEYLNNLIFEFDKDGIFDRQLEHKRTIEFVDTRSVFLQKELAEIENRKQVFKEENNLSDLQSDAQINQSQQFSYDAEIFKVESQKDLIKLISQSLNANKYKLMPVNIGLESQDLNNLINQHNSLIQERERYLLTVGPNNWLIKNVEKIINESTSNILFSIKNYEENLDLTIKNLYEKEDEFSSTFNKIPVNEKILRSIERELQIKESLFLLLLQKKEEAAINFAVVKPSIKIIDPASSSSEYVYPKKSLIIIMALVLSFLIPLAIIYTWFSLDTKLHTKKQFNSITTDIPVIGEIPFIKDEIELQTVAAPSSRSALGESIRMISSNFNFLLNDLNIENQSNSNVVLITSSVKGEGKTLISVNLASILSAKHKNILLVGADLRNPQLHKYFNIDKNSKGISDYVYGNDIALEDIINKSTDFDYIISGPIPPNPIEVLSSKRFKNMISNFSKKYDFILIDSAPTLLVSDTFEISNLVSMSIYVARSNFTDIKLCEYINSLKSENKLPKINVVLNGIGNSSSYGYKYGYQYGYQYGYKYGYNYGYGYGYKEDKD